MLTFAMQPIGQVENDVEEPLGSAEIARRPSRIRIEARFSEGLLGLEEERHIVVIFLFDRVHEVHLRLHPRDDHGRPLRGVFATRTQYRPNPIGVTVAELQRVEGNTLHVLGLDALNGTPVLDIKPYTPAFDAAPAQEGDKPATCG